MAYSERVDIQPVFKGLQGDSLVVDLSQGFCCAGDLAVMDGICPSPLPLFRR